MAGLRIFFGGRCALDSEVWTLCRILHGPVPVRLMLCGLVGSLLTFTAMLALSAAPPPAVGANVTAIVQLELADAAAPQVPPVTVKSPAFAPLMFSLKVSENGDKLVTVAFKVFDVVVSVPYESEFGVVVAGIVGPVLSPTV